MHQLELHVLILGFDCFWYEKWLLFGTCGVLDEDIKATSVIIPTALRDEGTSYHYQPASSEIAVNAGLGFSLGFSP